MHRRRPQWKQPPRVRPPDSRRPRFSLPRHRAEVLIVEIANFRELAERGLMTLTSCRGVDGRPRLGTLPEWVPPRFRAGRVLIAGDALHQGETLPGT